jgi:glycosyltransferase involved in cell wall biosynthesis
MDNPLVSIIVPVYKVESYIKECLDSICAQTYNNIEIIVIDDGTPDNAGRIADECAKNDSRITVIHQANGGVSTARNTGLNAAIGDFVIFVDSDDYLAPDYTEYMLNLLLNTQSEMAVSLNFFSTDKPNSKQIERKNERDTYTPSQALEAIYLYRIGVACWNKIYRRDFIEKNNLRFMPELWFGEVMTFNVEAFQKANRIAVGCRKVYYARTNPDSATRKFNLASWECGLRALEIQKNNFTVHDKKVIQAWNFHYWWGCFCIVREIVKAGLEKEYESEQRKYSSYLRKNFIAPFLIPSRISRKKWFALILLSPKIAAQWMIAREKRKELRRIRRR